MSNSWNNFKRKLRRRVDGAIPRNPRPKEPAANFFARIPGEAGHMQIQCGQRPTDEQRAELAVELGKRKEQQAAAWRAAAEEAQKAQEAILESAAGTSEETIKPKRKPRAKKQLEAAA